MARRRRLGRALTSIGRTSIGRRILHAEPFDARAEDGDGDGLVQDGTQWERPTTKPIDGIARTIASRITGGTPEGRGAAASRVAERAENPYRSLTIDLPLFETQASEQLRRLGAIGRDATVSLEKSRAMRRKMDDDLQKRLGPTIYQQIETNPRVATQMLKRYFPNIKKINHDFDAHKYSLNDAAQVKILLHKAMTDKDTAKYIREINLTLGDSTIGGLIVNGSHRFDLQNGGGALTLARLPHPVNTDMDNVKNHVVDTVNSLLKNPAWHPYNAAMIELIGSDLRRLNENVLEFYAMQATGTAVHEWAHANHYRSVLEKEFKLPSSVWNSSSKTLSNKMFRVMSASDRQQALQQAIFIENFSLYYGSMLANIKNNPDLTDDNKNAVTDFIRSFVEGSNGWIGFYRYASSQAHHIDESTGIKPRLMDQLDNSFEGLNEVIQLVDPSFDIRQFINETNQLADQIFDGLSLSSSNIENLDSLIERLNVGVGANMDPTQWQYALENIKIAFETSMVNMIAQRVFDSLSDEVKQKLAKELFNVSDYAAQFKNFSESGMGNTGGMEFWRLLQSYGGWQGSNPFVSIMEGIAELMTSFDHGQEPTSENLQKIIEFLNTKAASQSSGKITITLDEFNKLSQQIDGNTGVGLTDRISQHNWLTDNGPVTIELPPIPDVYKKQKKKKN